MLGNLLIYINHIGIISYCQFAVYIHSHSVFLLSRIIPDKKICAMYKLPSGVVISQIFKGKI